MAHLYFGLPKLVFLDMRYKFFYNIAVVERILELRNSVAALIYPGDQMQLLLQGLYVEPHRYLHN